MRVLFIGGTGNISSFVSQLAVAQGVELVHLNRGNRNPILGVRSVVADLHQPDQVRAAIASEKFDVVVNWIAFTPGDIQRDHELFRDRTDQYIFISSASCYQKPPKTPFVTESTPLENPHWEYSRNKIAAEELLASYDDFPFTIVRPSLTYGNLFPVAIGGWGCYTLADRIRRGAPIIVHGDGTSLWTVTHAEDFGLGFLGLLGNASALGEAVHITSDEVLTWNQIYQCVAEAVGVEPHIVHIPTDFLVREEPSLEGGLWGDKAHSVIFDNAKIKSLVPGFMATIPFSEGARRANDWFLADPARQGINADVNALMDRLLAAYGR